MATRSQERWAVQEFIEAGVVSVPQCFVKHEKERFIVAEENDDSIPIIDMLSADDADLVKADEIAAACKDCGFFQLVNHGIPHSLMERMMDLVAEYFRMALEDRVLEWQKQAPPASGIRDWVDSQIHRVKPSGPDLSPSKRVPEGYRETLSEYVEEALKVVKKVQRVLSVKLGLSPSRFDEVIGEHTVDVRVNYYPPCPEPDLVLGLTPHSDAGIVTVLLQNNVKGLQVFKNGRWITVEPVPNAIVVNLADLFQVISNGVYKSCEHRAFASAEATRLSIAVFVNPHHDRLVGPLEELVDEDSPALFRETTFSEHINHFHQAGLRNKLLLEHLRISTSPVS